MKKCLFVARDLMSAKILDPMIDCLIGKGIAVALIMEGKSVGILEKKNCVQFLARGDDSLTPFGKVRAETLLGELEPDALFVGTSSPINWELEFAWAARKNRIPVIAVSDIWGGLSRLNGFMPNIGVVTDNSETTKEDANQYVVIGDIASNVDVGVKPEAQSKLAELESANRTLETVLIVGDNLVNVLEVVELTAESVRMSDVGEYVVIPRLVHPKLVNDPNVIPILEKAEKLLQGIRVNKFAGLSTDALAARCHYTVTSYSTPIRIALHHGQRGISIAGPKSLEMLKQETGFELFPLVARDVIPAINTPFAISAFSWEEYDKRSQLWAESAKFLPENACEKILRILS